MVRDDPELYHYIEARVAARELDRAGGDASGAVDNYGAANRIWALSAQWEKKWRAMLPASPEVATETPTTADVAVLVDQERADTSENGDITEEAGPEEVPHAGGVIQPEDVS